jgi:hypothetical protein
MAARVCVCGVWFHGVGLANLSTFLPFSFTMLSLLCRNRQSCWDCSPPGAPRAPPRSSRLKRRQRPGPSRQRFPARPARPPPLCTAAEEEQATAAAAAQVGGRAARRRRAQRVAKGGWSAAEAVRRAAKAAPAAAAAGRKRRVRARERVVVGTSARWGPGWRRERRKGRGRTYERECAAARGYSGGGCCGGRCRTLRRTRTATASGRCARAHVCVCGSVGTRAAPLEAEPFPSPPPHARARARSCRPASGWRAWRRPTTLAAAAAVPLRRCSRPVGALDQRAARGLRPAPCFLAAAPPLTHGHTAAVAPRHALPLGCRALRARLPPPPARVLCRAVPCAAPTFSPCPAPVPHVRLRSRAGGGAGVGPAVPPAAGALGLHRAKQVPCPPPRAVHATPRDAACRTTHGTWHAPCVCMCVCACAPPPRGTFLPPCLPSPPNTHRVAALVQGAEGTALLLAAAAAAAAPATSSSPTATIPTAAASSFAAVRGALVGHVLLLAAHGLLSGAQVLRCALILLVGAFRSCVLCWVVFVLAWRGRV